MASSPTPAGGYIIAAGAIVAAADDVNLSNALSFLRAASVITCDSQALLTPDGRNCIGALPRPENFAGTHSELVGLWRRATGLRSSTSTLRLAARDPARWGPIMWQALHDLSAFYSARTASCLRTLLRHLLPAVLPCAKCRRHVADHLYALRETFARAKTRVAFVDAVIQLHNCASRAIKGPGRAMIYPPLAESRALSGPKASTEELLVLLRNHGRSSVPGEDEDREECGCTERRALAQGELWFS